MNKTSRHIRLILLLALIVPTSGWTVSKIAVNLNFPIVIANANQNDLAAIDNALKDFKTEKDNFIQQLNDAVNDPGVKKSLKSQVLNYKLAVLNGKIDQFKKSGLSQLNPTQKNQIQQLLNDVKTNNQDISDTIITPLKDGLGCEQQTGKCTNLEAVQTELNSVEEQEEEKITVNGKLGPGTIGKIDEFLGAKITDSETKLQSVRQKIQEFESKADAGVDAGAGTGVGTGVDAGVDAGAGKEAEADPGAETETDTPTEEILTTKQIESLINQKNKNLNTISLVALSLSIIALLPILILIKTNKSNKLSVNNQDSLSNQSFIPNQEVEESDWDNNDNSNDISDQNDVSHQILTILDGQLPLIINRQIDWKLRSIKYELREEIIESLRVKVQKDIAYSDVQSSQVQEQPNYQSQQRDRNQSQSRARSENTSKSLSQSLSCSILRLVQTYNRNPLSIWRNALEVAETQTSFYNRQSGKNLTMTLANKNRGIYAVLEEKDNYFLFPSQNFRITDHNYKIIQAVFECHEYQKDYAERFYLVEPAKVSLMPDGKEWKLDEKGVLNFNPDYPVIELRKQLEQANKEKEQFQSKLEEIENERQQLKFQVKELINKQNPSLFVQTYNRDPRSSTQNAIEVSETQKSISDRSLGISNTVTLENKNRGSYAIVAEGNFYYLVPNKSLRITDSNYKRVQGLFECRGSKKGYSENFQLIKPATVYPLSGNQWQLQERGILEFI